jgi:hypothetical protein
LRDWSPAWRSLRQTIRGVVEEQKRSWTKSGSEPALLFDDVRVLPQDKIDPWFLLWFDLDHKRHDPVAFGTAPPEAFWEFLEILESAGASTLWISSSIDQATPV